MNSAQRKRAITCVGLGVVALLVVILAWNFGRTSSRKVFNTAERLTETAHREYAEGSFESATDALKTEIEYLERNRNLLAKYLRVDMLLKTAYSRIAYMLLHTNNTQEAAHYMREACVHYNRTLAETPEKQVQAGDFMEHLLKGMDHIDQRTGAKWKSEFTLNTNTIERVNAVFLSDASAPSQPHTK